MRTLFTLVFIMLIGLTSITFRDKSNTPEVQKLYLENRLTRVEFLVDSISDRFKDVSPRYWKDSIDHSTLIRLSEEEKQINIELNYLRGYE